jgi:hypothetical protein
MNGPVAKMTADNLQKALRQGKENLLRLAQGEASSASVNENLYQLQQVVAVAAERVRRLSEWNVAAVQEEAEAAFDGTIEAVEEYLALVKDNGPVHQAATKVRAAALDQARIFREKASAKSSQRYQELSERMEKQAHSANSAWEAIARERENAELSLAALRDYRELYIDVRTAEGIAEAVKELQAVRKDLERLSESMKQVQKAVANEAVPERGNLGT